PAEAQSIVRFVKAPEALAARLALVGVVDAKEGARLAATLTPGARLVSKDGDLWRWDGFVRRADAPLSAAVRLEHKNRLAAADKELKAAQAQALHAKTIWEHARAARIEHEVKARALRAELATSANEAAEAARVAQSAEAETQRAQERREELASQAEALSAEIASARSALATTYPASTPEAADADAIPAAREAVNAARAAAADALLTAQSLVRERAQRSSRRQSINTETTQWRARADAATARLAALSRELDDIVVRRDAALAAPVAARAKLEALMQEAALAERRRADASDTLAQAETEARRRNETQRALEQAHAAVREVRAGAEAHAAAATTRVSDIVARALEQAGRAPEDLVNLAGALISGPLASAPIADVERRLERLKAERDAAGPVNLRAEEELAEAQDRIASLRKEKDDVAQGIAKLRRAITALNNEGRARLLRAFEEVDAHFAQLFATLFEGGQANLKLTENEDPLEAGLEIFAEPPGKRLTNLSLLSGGEQALTATALIFAVFLANPAPLCVLDEVDAPLDDANVDRFCRMLDEMKRLTSTRFLVITHNPVTMSRMDRLYGVTMPEQGVSQLVSVDLVRAQAMAAE
ncbi:MAG: chromosome segregation protein SMC, partial [Terricaulis sp.]